VILEILKNVLLPTERRILEIGAETGQHAVHFAPHFPQLEWNPTDLSINLAGMNL
jgi:hypothetical protein